MRARPACAAPALLALAVAAAPLPAADGPMPFQPLDVFELEWASDPQISPDGSRVAYVRNRMDVMTDRVVRSVWLVEVEGSRHRPLNDGTGSETSPRWSPDGDRLLYVAGEGAEERQLWVRWMDNGQAARLTHLTETPGDVTWSPDGAWIAFTMHVPAEPSSLAEMPPKPDGADWAEPPRVIERMIYRADGAGYLEGGFQHLFLVRAEGGTPRQLTTGDFRHGNRASWTADGSALLFSANRHEEWEYDPLNSEIYRVDVASGAIEALTDRQGPDRSPVVSPDGSRVAYLGFDDRLQGYQLSRLYVMGADGGGRREVTGSLDRGVQTPLWSADGDGIYFRTVDRGNGKVAHASLDGEVTFLADDLGQSIGRPYGGGSYSVAPDGRFAYTRTRPDRPADVAVGGPGIEGVRLLTDLNADLLTQRELAAVEEVWWESSHDGRRIQGWIAKPPGFDPAKRYPLILEIHGGPFANYGDRFSAEMQLYAVAGYVVLYANPRGSTSYGEEFGNLIHHAYPGNDFDDLMSGVDAILARGFVDEEQLFVTGGSGGGVLTAWTVGKTDRFRAAVSAKPVINWYSFTLTADAYNFFYKYWFPAPPWERPEEYLRRSPLSLVGKVTTPTMLLTGEADYRTPISESEQYYQALKLRQVDTALVRIPGASHSIASRPSRLIAKVNHILAWFERYRKEAEAPEEVS